MKEMKKKLIKSKNADKHIIAEKELLQITKSPFVLNLKYAFDDSQSVFLIIDLCQGGDLKFQLQQAPSDHGGFEIERARFYAAEVLLGLNHIHSLNYVYRDLKPENILLTSKGLI